MKHAGTLGARLAVIHESAEHICFHVFSACFSPDYIIAEKIQKLAEGL